MNLSLKNHRTRRALYLALVLGLAFLPTTASAGDFELGFGFVDVQFDDNIGGDSDIGFDFRAGYYLNERFELEIESMSASALFDADLQTWTLNAVFNFRTGGSFVPYVLVGAGRARLDVGSLFGPSFDDDGFAYKAGAGARFFFGRSKHASFRLEVAALGEDTFDENSIHGILLGGLGWKF